MTLAEQVAAQIDPVIADLADLVAIESVSADPHRADAVQASAEVVAELLRAAGSGDVRVVEAGGAPAVIARFPGPPGTPTVCLYAHHDVQPEGPREAWASDPFIATERDGRLYGRGTADDKGGLAVHLATLRAYAGRPPVGVTVFVEGEEEIGSPSLVKLLAAYHDALAADVYVVADSDNWATGVPALTTSLRGLVDCVVEVRTLDHAVHSGGYGGVVPDALTALCRLLATLHDEAGNVAVAGLRSSPGPDLDYPPDRLRAESGVLDGVDYLGEGSVVERMWTRPACAVIALDATPVAEASNTLIPAARAKVSLRVAPGDSARAALRALTAHLQAAAPWGARVAVTPGDLAEPSALPATGRYVDAARAALETAFGTPAVTVGQGGSIPLVAELAGAYPAATIVVTAVADPDARAHGANESLGLADFRAACLAEAHMLQGFAEVGRG